jgi:hypothetical protein
MARSPRRDGLHSGQATISTSRPSAKATSAVSGGGGQFDGAEGLITSNFTLDGAGSVIDHPFGVIDVC